MLKGLGTQKRDKGKQTHQKDKVQMCLINKENRILELTNVTCWEKKNYQPHKCQIKYKTFCYCYSLGKWGLPGLEAQNCDDFVIKTARKIL